MNKNYRKNFLRENIMYGVYGRILLEHFSDSYDYLEKFKKLNKKTNSYDEFSNIKNQISHRSLAVKKLVNFLNSNSF